MGDLGNISSVSVVGAGNVGWHMARAMHQSGVRIIHVLSRTLEHAEKLAGEVSAIPVARFENLSKEPDMYLLSVDDTALPEVTAGFVGKEAIIVHTSGSTGTEIFNAGIGKFGVFYPLQTFTQGNDMEYGKIPFLVEGSSTEVTDRLMGLANKVSGIVYETDSETRLKVHIAAVFACNFSNHLAAIADHLLTGEGLNIELIRPLIQETYRKLSLMDPQSAQTGPAVRDDRKIIEKHLEVLKEMPLEQRLYNLLTNNIIRFRNKQDEQSKL